MDCNGVFWCIWLLGALKFLLIGLLVVILAVAAWLGLDL